MTFEYDGRHGPALRALKFLAGAHFAPLLHLQLAAGTISPGFLEFLINEKFIERGGRIPDAEWSQEISDADWFLYTLTKKGASVVGGMPFNLSKLEETGLQRALMAQYETLVSAVEFGIEDYSFKRSPGKTGPVARWICTGGREFDVRVELFEWSNTCGEFDRLFATVVVRPTVFIFGTGRLQEKFIWLATQYVQQGIPGWVSVGSEWVEDDRHIHVPQLAWEQIYLKVSKDEGLRSLKDWGVDRWGALLCSARSL